MALEWPRLLRSKRTAVAPQLRVPRKEKTDYEADMFSALEETGNQCWRVKEDHFRNQPPELTGCKCKRRTPCDQTSVLIWGSTDLEQRKTPPKPTNIGRKEHTRP